MPFKLHGFWKGKNHDHSAMDPRDVNTFLSAIEEMKKQGRLPRCANLDRRRFAHEIDEHFRYIGGWFGMICSTLALKEASLHNQMEVSF